MTVRPGQRRDYAAEFRALELGLEVAELKRALVRLRQASLDHVSRPGHESLERLRHELGRTAVREEAHR